MPGSKMSVLDERRLKTISKPKTCVYFDTFIMIQNSMIRYSMDTQCYYSKMSHFAKCSDSNLYGL